MGFYAPAQIVRDARNHGVTVLPVDVNYSDWNCTIELHEDQHALRLGYRMVKGMPQVAANAISEARQRVGRFTSIQQVHNESGISRKHMKKLAEADAFKSLGMTRRDALWQVMSLSDESYPLFDNLYHHDNDAEATLPPMPIGQEVMTDYATTGLSLKRHPVSLVRDQLDEMNITAAAKLLELPQDRWVKVAGLVLIRQRPGTASDVVFETIEDETGTANIIIKPDVYEHYRSAARHARFIQVDGYIERNGDVIHIMAKRLIDLSHMLSDLEARSRDFH